MSKNIRIQYLTLVDRFLGWQDSDKPLFCGLDQNGSSRLGVKKNDVGQRYKNKQHRLVLTHEKLNHGRVCRNLDGANLIGRSWLE